MQKFSEILYIDLCGELGYESIIQNRRNISTLTDHVRHQIHSDKDYLFYCINILPCRVLCGHEWLLYTDHEFPYSFPVRTSCIPEIWCTIYTTCHRNYGMNWKFSHLFCFYRFLILNVHILV
jgi:hypothetical protein